VGRKRCHNRYTHHYSLQLLQVTTAVTKVFPWQNYVLHYMENVNAAPLAAVTEEVAEGHFESVHTRKAMYAAPALVRHVFSCCTPTTTQRAQPDWSQTKISRCFYDCMQQHKGWTLMCPAVGSEQPEPSPFSTVTPASLSSNSSDAGDLMRLCVTCIRNRTSQSPSSLSCSSTSANPHHHLDCLRPNGRTRLGGVLGGKTSKPAICQL
jgi:hypothetical protein